MEEKKKRERKKEKKKGFSQNPYIFFAPINYQKQSNGKIHLPPLQFFFVFSLCESRVKRYIQMVAIAVAIARVKWGTNNALSDINKQGSVGLIFYGSNV